MQYYTTVLSNSSRINSYNKLDLIKCVFIYSVNSRSYFEKLGYHLLKDQFFFVGIWSFRLAELANLTVGKYQYVHFFSSISFIRNLKKEFTRKCFEIQFSWFSSYSWYFIFFIILLYYQVPMTINSDLSLQKNLPLNWNLKNKKLS